MMKPSQEHPRCVCHPLEVGARNQIGFRWSSTTLLKRAMTLGGLLLVAVLSTSTALKADPPWYDDRRDLLWYKDDVQDLRSVKTERDWLDA